MKEFALALGLGPQAVAWFGLQLLLMMLAALVARPSPARRFASVPLMLACMLLPCVAPLSAFLRMVLACMGLLAVLKTLQLAYEPRWARHHPVWHGLSPFDVSTARRAPPKFDARLFALVLGHAVLLALAVAALILLPVPASPIGASIRLLLGALLVYCAMETATESLRFAHALFGFDVPPVQRLPAAARSVGEFWSERWNRPVSAWLAEYAFAPLVRKRRPVLALVTAFAISASIHAWMFYAGLGWRAAVSACAFFLLQAPVVMLESKLRVSRWPAPLAHAWTLGWLLATSPLFVQPILQALGL
jgi:hypothetical protein